MIRNASIADFPPHIQSKIAAQLLGASEASASGHTAQHRQPSGEAPGNRVRPRASKYRNQIIEANGERFHSKGEFYRWQQLKLMEAAGEIAELQRQVKIPLMAQGGQMVGIIVIDFRYDNKDGREVFEDFKGFATPLAKWKLAHLRAQYPLTHVVVSRA